MLAALRRFEKLGHSPSLTQLARAVVALGKGRVPQITSYPVRTDLDALEKQGAIRIKRGSTRHPNTYEVLMSENELRSEVIFGDTMVRVPLDQEYVHEWGYMRKDFAGSKIPEPRSIFDDAEISEIGGAFNKCSAYEAALAIGRGDYIYVYYTYDDFNPHACWIHCVFGPADVHPDAAIPGANEEAPEGVGG